MLIDTTLYSIYACNRAVNVQDIIWRLPDYGPERVGQIVKEWNEQAKAGSLEHGRQQPQRH